jgi:acylpyruvate hydrolase
MRLVRFETEQGCRTGFVEDGQVFPSGDGRDVMELLRTYGTDFQEMQQAVTVSQSETALPLASVKLAAPLPRPGKILGIGRNYGAHASEGGLAAQEKPRIFMKPATAISGPGAAVKRPESVQKLDFEGELVAVLGQLLHDADIASAAAAIGGYMIGNDLSARELQFDVSPPQTSFAKGMDGFAAIGPCLITADEVGSAPDLQLATFVNGVEMQKARTGELIFSIAECISHISRYMTLEPGDLIFTGTPAGVGYFREPQVFLQPGDRVTVEIEKIGSLETIII